jgi:hypothetical protein
VDTGAYGGPVYGELLVGVVVVAIEIVMRANTVAMTGSPIVRGIYMSSNESGGVTFGFLSEGNFYRKLTG